MSDLGNFWWKRAKLAEQTLDSIERDLAKWNEGTAQSADDPHVIKAIDTLAEYRAERG